MNSHVESLRPFWDKLIFCSIDQETLKRVAKDIARIEIKPSSCWRGVIYPQEDSPETVIQFFGVLNTINFCFTDFRANKSYDVFYKDKMWFGSEALTAAFSRALDEGIDLLNPFILANMKTSTSSHIFRHHSVPMPMISERTINMRHCGGALLTSGWDTFENLFRECDYRLFNDGHGIVEHLTRTFCCYRDEVEYHGDILKFSKRAQLFPLLYHGRALSSNGKLQPIRDPEHFGPIVDYRVPQALRSLGILKYDQLLEHRIDSGLLIVPESAVEIDIRLATAKAVVMLMEEINASRQNPISMVELDCALWTMGRSPKLSKSKHHYTYTTAY